MAFTDDSDFEFEDTPEDPQEIEESPLPAEEEETGNRTFIIVLLVGIAAIILTLVCMIIFFVSRGNEQRAIRETQIAEINAQNTAVVMAVSQTAEVLAWTPTPSNTLPPNTPTVTPTAVVALPTDTPTPAPSETPPGGIDPRTATVEALLTLGAETGTPGPTALPDTGFLDDVGLPGLLLAAAALVLVIFLARRLRTAG
jgi:hypothetical protein